MKRLSIASAREVPFWQIATSLATAVLLVVIPLPRRRFLVERPYYPVHIEFTSFVLYPSDWLVLSILLLAAGYLWRRHSSLHFGPLWLTVPLFLLPAGALLSAHWAADPALAAHIASRLFLLFALYLALVNVPPLPAIVQWGAAISVVVQSGAAILQFIRQEDLGLRWLGELELEAARGGTSIVASGETVWLRGYGITPHPNILGGLLVVTLLPLVAAYLRRRGWQRGGWLLFLMMGTGGVLVTFSRSAWLSLAAGGGLLLLGVLAEKEWRPQYGRSLVLLLLVGLLVVAGFAWRQRALLAVRLGTPQTDTEIQSVSERGVLTAAALELIRPSPWRGLGAGQLAIHIIPLVADNPIVGAQPVHNMPLLLTAELGLLGGGVWIWLMVVPLPIAYRRWRRGKLSVWEVAITASLMSFALLDMFDYYSWNWQQGRLMHWLFFALWAGAISNKNSGS